MNFCVIEGEREILSTDDLERLEVDYLGSSLTSLEVRQKYNLSKKNYSIVTRWIRDKYSLLLRPYPSCKYYYQQGNCWIIRKYIDGELVYIGSLRVDVFSEDDVRLVVEECKNMQWNIGECRELVQVLGGGVIE